MSEGSYAEAAQNSLMNYPMKEADPRQNLTCGENLERKISEQKERLANLESALEEMKTTGLYNVKISTLRDTMSW